jgi:hypothetical protein
MIISLCITGLIFGFCLGRFAGLMWKKYEERRLRSYLRKRMKEFLKSKENKQ